MSVEVEAMIKAWDRGEVHSEWEGRPEFKTMQDNLHALLAKVNAG